MTPADLRKIEKKLDVEFKDPTLLKTALTHRSYLNENRDQKEHNERLEYLGDAVLEFLVSKFLYAKYPDKPEGELTSIRSATVKTQTLADASIELDLGRSVMMSKGEEATGGRDKEYILANTFEAVLGAIYLDRGITKCETFLKKNLFPQIDVIVENRLDIDPKTKFQEISQEVYKITPTYQLMSETGPDHNKTFIMSVYIGDKLYGKGKGGSKQRAEESAAKAGLMTIRKEKKLHKLPTQSSLKR